MPTSASPSPLTNDASYWKGGTREGVADAAFFPEGMFAQTHTSTRVTGVFELRDGKIAAWRDYYDLKTGWLDQVGIDHAAFTRSLSTT